MPVPITGAPVLFSDIAVIVIGNGKILDRVNISVYQVSQSAVRVCKSFSGIGLGIAEPCVDLRRGDMSDNIIEAIVRGACYPFDHI